MFALNRTNTCSHSLCRYWRISKDPTRFHSTRRSFHDSTQSDQLNESRRPRTIFSGIQPTGIPHLGNYLGALRQWKHLQDTSQPQDRLLFSLVDLHAITIQQSPLHLHKWKQESLAILLALGLDPHHSTIFHQSDVPEHTQLMWILSCLTSTGKLTRMTQWKDKTSNTTSEEKLKLGLFSYPVLQAADILLYETTHVPVGEDQAQHLELARNLASVFNHNHGRDILVQPETWISPAKRIMNLQNPTAKMSKSAGDPISRVLLTDSDEEVRLKIKKAKTDSGVGVGYEPTARPGVANLIDILHACRERASVAERKTNEEVVTEKKEIAETFRDGSMKALKDEVGDAVIEVITPIRESYLEHLSQPNKLLELGVMGSERARKVASATLQKVQEAMGLR